MTEEEAWERAMELNRELGQRAAGHRDPAYDADMPDHPGDGCFVAWEPRTTPGTWEVVFQRDSPSVTGGFFSTLWGGFKTLLGEIFLRP